MSRRAKPSRSKAAPRGRGRVPAKVRQAKAKGLDKAEAMTRAAILAGKLPAEVGITTRRSLALKSVERLANNAAGLKSTVYGMGTEIAYLIALDVLLDHQPVSAVARSYGAIMRDKGCSPRALEEWVTRLRRAYGEEFAAAVRRHQLSVDATKYLNDPVGGMDALRATLMPIAIAKAADASDLHGDALYPVTNFLRTVSDLCEVAVKMAHVSEQTSKIRLALQAAIDETERRVKNGQKVTVTSLCDLVRRQAGLTPPATAPASTKPGATLTTAPSTAPAPATAPASTKGAA